MKHTGGGRTRQPAFSQRFTRNNNNASPQRHNPPHRNGAAGGASSIMVSSVVSTSTVTNEDIQPKAKCTVTTINPPKKIDRYDLYSIRSNHVPSLQSTQLHQRDEIASSAYGDRLLNIMKLHGLTFEPIQEGRCMALRVVGNPKTNLIMCTAVTNEGRTSKKCECNKYFEPQFQILGSSCHFCGHSVHFHRVKPEHEEIIFHPSKTSESDRNEYKYWFDKFIELQRLYSSTKKNLPYDKNLFIEIYDKPRQAALSFSQSPNNKYALVKYSYDSAYDEGEYLFLTRYQVISLETIQPIKTDEALTHSCSDYGGNAQMESGFRTIVWDLNQPATLVATGVADGDSYDAFVHRIVNIECPSVS